MQAKNAPFTILSILSEHANGTRGIVTCPDVHPSVALVCKADQIASGKASKATGGGDRTADLQMRFCASPPMPVHVSYQPNMLKWQGKNDWLDQMTTIALAGSKSKLRPCRLN